jgi:hypothetical protein
MATLALDLRHQSVVREIRSECAVCGVHATGWRASLPGASCSNCGSHQMRPVAVKPRD